ncbi:MAG TPA: hypothetical protein VFM44_02835 [Gemmatimonadota bacterium]|nr:hypothetical protein [Gemmatimonadota bacterium]
MNADERAGVDPEVIAELKRLGKQVGETLDAAWRSAERRKVQEELRSGARAFVDECERALNRAGTARPAEMASKARRSAVEALRWMSAELESLADRFTPAVADGEEPPDEGERR